MMSTLNHLTYGSPKWALNNLRFTSNSQAKPKFGHLTYENLLIPLALEVLICHVAKKIILRVLKLTNII